MNDAKRFSLVKPGRDTKFHIDFEWWKQHDSNWRVYLLNLLCPEHQEKFADTEDDQTIDWVDPATAEVQTLDGLQHILITHCAKQPGFMTEHTALVDAVFRTFLANGNMPMTPVELEEKVAKPADTIVRTFAGTQIYKGIRPCSTC